MNEIYFYYRASVTSCMVILVVVPEMRKSAATTLAYHLKKTLALAKVIVSNGRCRHKRGHPTGKVLVYMSKDLVE